MKEKHKNPTHRILIKIRDRSKPIIVQDDKKIIPVQWVEVSEISLGSRKNPNKAIFEVKIEPIEYEPIRRPFFTGDD
jgi:hypothetical protein